MTTLRKFGFLLVLAACSPMNHPSSTTPNTATTTSNQPVQQNAGRNETGADSVSGTGTRTDTMGDDSGTTGNTGDPNDPQKAPPPPAPR